MVRKQIYQVTASSKIDYKRKGDDFLKWAMSNKELLKTAVAKTTTFDTDIFDEIWGTALMKVYTALVNRHVEIASIKNYAYTAIKWEFVAEQNRRRRHDNLHIRDYFQPLFVSEEEEKDYRRPPQPTAEEPEFDEVNEKEDTPLSTIPPDIIDEPDESEGRYRAVVRLLDQLKTVLSLEFGEEHAALFWDYMTEKIEATRATNYDDYAKANGYPSKYIGYVVKSAKQFVVSHPDFQHIDKIISSYADN